MSSSETSMEEVEGATEGTGSGDSITSAERNPSTDPNVRRAAKPIAPGIPVTPTPAPPPQWEGATHYVQYSHVINEEYDDTDDHSVPLRDTPHHQYQPVMYIPGTGETQIKLVEANLGAYWDLSLIHMEPEAGEVGYYYIESVHLFPVDGVENVSFYAPEDAEIAVESKINSHGNGLKKDSAQSSVGVGKKTIKIKDAELNSPYEENSHYNIVMDCATVSKEEYESQIEQFKRQSICKLLAFYGKKALDPEIITKLVENPFGLIQCSEPYYPLRPGQNIKTKVSIAKKYFNSFENATFDDFVVDNIHKDFLAVSLKATEFEKTIHELITTFNKYHKQVTKFTGTLDGLNYNKLGIKLKKFESEFKKFLVLNDIQLETRDADATFELGFDKNTFRLRYVIYFNSAGKFCSTGLNVLADNFDPSIGKVLVQYRDMLSSSVSGMAWMSFSTEFFAGEIEINFNSPSSVINSAKAPLSQLEGDMDILKADYDNIKYMTPLDASGLAKTIGGEEFRATASELLMRSRDFIGDQFLVDLPNILNNVEDLSSLYNLVFDKVSVKDLLDMVMEKAMTELNLPDVYEVKLRGLLQALDHGFVLDTLFDNLQTADIQDIVSYICNINTFGIKEYEDLVDSMPTIPMLSLYMVYFRDDGTLGGLLPAEYSGDIMEILDDRGIGDCVSLVTALATKQIDVTDFFQETAINEVLCQILTQGIDSLLPQLENPCPEIISTLQSLGMEALSPVEVGISGSPQFKAISFASLKYDILSFLKKLDKGVIMPSIDAHLKEQFKLSNAGMTATLSGTPPDIPTPTPTELFAKFAEIPAIKTELEKLDLTKSKLTGKIPGLPLDFETKKIDADFELPSIKDCNPSFDFGKFQFSGMQDMFGGAVGGIEDALIKGIEAGLVGAFKSILGGVVDSITANPPNLDSPNFGGLNMNDLLDATDGFSADAFAGMTADAINKAASKFDPDFFMDLCEELLQDVSEFTASSDDILDMIDDMSSALKPLELIRIMKGQKTDRDLGVMRDAIESDVLKQLMTDDIMDSALSVATDFMDYDMLDELEAAYSERDKMIAVCNDRGIPYGVRNIRQNLVDKYEDLDVEEINDLVNDIVDETKDSLVDAISAGAKGALGGDYTDNLPFSEDPCSFMPKPADIPALNFSNNMVFDSIFDPIELEYKAEAASYADMLLMPSDKKEYIKLYYDKYDFVLDVDEPYSQDSTTGEYTLNMKQVDEFGVYNQNFGNHYKGRQTPVYRRASTGRYIEIDPFVGSYDLKRNNDDTWSIDDDKDQIYVESTDQKLTPVPGLKYFYNNPAAMINFDNTRKQYKIRFKISENEVDDKIYTLPEIEDKIEPEVVLSFLPEFSAIETDTFPLSNVECKEDQVSVITPKGADSHYDYTQIIENAIYTCSQNIITAGEYFTTGLRASLMYKRDQPYDTSVRSTSMGVPQGQLFPKSMMHSLVHAFLDVMFNKISTTQLFETSYLQTFLFDTDAVNLFKVQDAKNKAKDEFNEECSFKEDGKNKLKSSSIKKLIYLTFRVYLIEIMARSCFLFDSINIQVMNEYICSMLYDRINADMSKYKNGYFELFKEEYEKEYGSTYPETSGITEKDVFYKLAKEIYEEISLEYDELFPTAASGADLIEAFLEEVPIYEDKKAGFGHYCVQAFHENSPFVIQRIQRKNYNHTPVATKWGITNSRERFYSERDPDVSDPGAAAAIEYVYRLCYIKRIDGQYSEISPTDEVAFPRTASALSILLDNYYTTQGVIDHHSIRQSSTHNKEQMYEAGITLSEATQAAYNLVGEHDDRVVESTQLHSYTQHMLSQTVAFRSTVVYTFEDSSTTHASFDIVPLAETVISANDAGTPSVSTWRSSPMNILISEGEGENSIYDFLRNKLQLNSYYNTIMSANNSRILFDKPDIALAFDNTKLAIKRAIETLTQDDSDYEFQDQETKDIQLEQAQGVGTEPDFSGKAAKMALMTIPMIIKGAAEMFDPNIKVSKGIRMGADLAGFNIPPPVASLMGLPFNLIPFAPGPPITPLGLIYLATSFLDPKERKKLSDLRRGKNINSAATEAGEFIEGTIEEQAEAARELAMDEIKKLVVKRDAIDKTLMDFRTALASVTTGCIQAIELCIDGRNFYSGGSFDYSEATRLPVGLHDAHPMPVVWGTGYMIFKAHYYDPDYDPDDSSSTIINHPGPASGATPGFRMNAYNNAGGGVVLWNTYKEYMSTATSGAGLYTGTDAPTTEDRILTNLNHLSNIMEDLFPVDGISGNDDMFETGVIAYGYTADDPSLMTWNHQDGNPLECDGVCDEMVHPTSDPRSKWWHASHNGKNGTAPHSNWYEWHSLYLKYLDKLSLLQPEASSTSYKSFKTEEQYEGARNLLFQMELYEYVVKRLIGVLAAHLLDIVSEGRTDELPGLSAIADGIMGTEADNIRKANLVYGTSVVPHTSPIEVQEYSYPDFDYIKAQAGLEYMSGKGQHIKAVSESSHTQFAELYVAAGAGATSQNWVDRAVGAAPLTKAIRMINQDDLGSIIRLLAEEAESLL